MTRCMLLPPPLGNTFHAAEVWSFVANGFANTFVLQNVRLAVGGAGPILGLEVYTFKSLLSLVFCGLMFSAATRNGDDMDTYWIECMLAETQRVIPTEHTASWQTAFHGTNMSCLYSILRRRFLDTGPRAKRSNRHGRSTTSFGTIEHLVVIMDQGVEFNRDITTFFEQLEISRTVVPHRMARDIAAWKGVSRWQLAHQFHRRRLNHIFHDGDTKLMVGGWSNGLQDVPFIGCFLLEIARTHPFLTCLFTPWRTLRPPRSCVTPLPRLFTQK